MQGICLFILPNKRICFVVLSGIMIRVILIQKNCTNLSFEGQK